MYGYLKKARDPYTGQWDLPGGSFEFGETPLEPLHREFIEETGLTVTKSKLLEAVLKTVPYLNSGNLEATVHHIGIIY